MIKQFRIGRVERQLLAVGALSLALVAVVLGVGGFAVSQLGGTPPSARNATSTTAGVYHVVTPVPTPFASPHPRVPAIHAAAPTAATVSFRPPVVASRPAPVASTPKVSKKKAPKQRTRRHKARKPARKLVPASQPTAAVASVAPAPAAKPVRSSPRFTRGNSGKPKAVAPLAQAPATTYRAPARPQVWKAPKAKPVHAHKPKPVRAAPAPAPVAAPPAHGNNGHGHGANGVGPGAAKGHGKGH